VKPVFVDSGAFYGHLVAEDAAHDMAVALFTRAKTENWDLVTTNFIVAETYALLINRARRGRQEALRLLDAVQAGTFRVERVTPDDEARAMALVRQHADKGYSLCDAMSFVVMERLGITEALAFDRHFVEYGRFAIL
jgi:uncharacterized protein